MDKKTKLTLDELIRRKEQILANKKRDETAEVFVKSIDGSVIVKSPDSKLLSDVEEMDDKIAANAYIVYNCVISPRLKDQHLQEVYGCREPIEIVDKLFLPGEVVRLADTIVKLAGFDEERVQTIKN